MGISQIGGSNVFEIGGEAYEMAASHQVGSMYQLATRNLYSPSDSRGSYVKFKEVLKDLQKGERLYLKHLRKEMKNIMRQARKSARGYVRTQFKRTRPSQMTESRRRRRPKGGLAGSLAPKVWYSKKHQAMFGKIYPKGRGFYGRFHELGTQYHIKRQFLQPAFDINIHYMANRLERALSYMANPMSG